MRIQSHKNGSTTTSDYAGNLPNSTKKNTTRNHPTHTHTQSPSTTQRWRAHRWLAFSAAVIAYLHNWEKAKQRSRKREKKRAHIFWSARFIFVFLMIFIFMIIVMIMSFTFSTFPIVIIERKIVSGKCSFFFRHLIVDLHRQRLRLQSNKPLFFRFSFLLLCLVAWRLVNFVWLFLFQLLFVMSTYRWKRFSCAFS